MAHGEDFDPSNYRRYELINKIFHYGIRDAEFDSVSTGEESIGKTKHLSERGDLGQRVSDAISNGYRSIHIHEHEDGTDWQWDTDVSYEVSNKEGLEIVVSDTATIDYTGSGWPLTHDGQGDGDTRLRLIGGYWIASGDPSGWLRIIDSSHNRISPQRVDFTNSTDDAKALEFRNKDDFCELSVIEGVYEADFGIDFVPASENPNSSGSGTESFQGTTIRDVAINVAGNKSGVDNFAIRPAGEFRYSTIRRPNLFGKVDDVVGILFDADRWDGGVISCPQFESASGTNHTAYKAASENAEFYAPIIIGGSADLSAGGTVWDTGSVDEGSPYRIKGKDDGLLIEKIKNGAGNTYQMTMDNIGTTTFPSTLNLKGDLQKNGSNSLFLRDGGIEIPRQDLSALSLGNNENGEMYHHNGTASINADGGTTSSEGYYVWSGSDSEFKSVVQY